MTDTVLSQYEYSEQHRDDYVRCSKSQVIRKTLMGFFIGFTIFSVLYSLFHGNGGILSHFLNTKVYDLPSIKSVLNPYNNSKLMHDKAQGPATCLIIIRSIEGALGNKMFIFASAYGLARLHQCQLYVAPWLLNSLRSVFRIDINETKVQLTTDDSLVVNRTDIYRRFNKCTLFSDLFRIPLNPTFNRYELTGYHQAYGYFEKYKEEINFLFQFSSVIIVRNVPVVEDLLKAVWNISLDLRNYTKDNVPHPYLKSLLINPPASLIPVTWVGIHIRRGDFLINFRIDTSVEYLSWAMNYYRRKYFNCRFLIASDDKKYVKTNLGNNSDVFITPSNFSAGDDLAALALCEHTIITAGTYGWWAAWLAGGNAVHDLNYPVPFQNCIKEHYFPPWFLFPHNSSSLQWKAPTKNK